MCSIIFLKKKTSILIQLVHLQESSNSTSKIREKLNNSILKITLTLIIQVIKTTLSQIQELIFFLQKLNLLLKLIGKN